MATPEGKSETKQDSKPETKPESKEVEENQYPPLKYKAWVLKVSIHCEGCRRKVEKTLRKIDGVYEAFADLKQQKAMVKANLHVDAETLIKKLIKKGRHAELWPEKAEQKEKKQGKSKNKDKQSGQANNDQEDSSNNNNNNQNHGADKDKETVKVEVLAHHPETVGKSCEKGSTGKNAECCNVSKAHEVVASCKSGVQFKEVKPENRQTVTVVVGNQSPIAEKSGGGDCEGNAGGEKSGSGSGSKKNKKKGQKGNANANVTIDEGEHSGDAGPAYHGPHGSVPLPSPASHSPPRQHHQYDYPTYYNAPPVYVTSYNTAYPSGYSTTSYYASPPPYSYTYMHPGPMTEHTPSDLETYSSQPSDSFEMFSDENPNACTIM